MNNNYNSKLAIKLFYFLFILSFECFVHMYSHCLVFIKIFVFEYFCVGSHNMQYWNYENDIVCITIKSGLEHVLCRNLKHVGVCVLVDV